MEATATSTEIVRSSPNTAFDHLETLVEPLRCRMLLLLERHELTVSELCAVLQLPQSTVSRHLKTLSDAGWVTSRRDGTSRFYAIATDDLDALGRQLWPLIREQVGESSTAAQDNRRLSRALQRRRSQSAAFFASAASKWDDVRDELFGGAFQTHALLALLERNLVVGDLGCGTGTFTEVIASFALEVIAVDDSPEMLEAARHRFAESENIDVRRGTLEALPIEQSQLDLAVLGLVLHHVPDPAIVLSECQRVVRPGGRVLIVDMLPHDRTDYQQQMGHVWLGFSARQVHKLLTAAGFTHTRIQPLPVDEKAKGPSLFVAIAENTRDETLAA